MNNMSDIENEYIKMWITDGIMYGKYKPGIEIDLKAAKAIVKDRIELAEGKDYPTIGYLDGMNSVTKEARDFFSNEGVKCMKGLALITTSPISKIIGNFFLNISKPKVPTRLFTKETDALKWFQEME